ncbi:MAG: putative rane protein [Pseudonocardiales bacterium]|nr:putative rane protein [Pseudonocardiales bacterium]
MSTTALVPTVADDATWHRLSPRMLLVHPVTEVIRAIPALIGVFLAGTSQGNHWWGVIGAGVVAVLSLSRWFTTRLRITPEQVQLRKGLLRRTTIATKRDRIRTVDVTSHLLHRVLGLARVVIGTGTSDRKGGGRIILDGLSVEAATTLRDDLLHRTTPAIDVSLVKRPQEEPREEPQLREIARLDRAWIRYAPFTLSGVVTGLVIWGFYWRVQGESGVDLLRSGPLRSVTSTLDRMPTAAAVLVVAAAVVLFVAISSTVGYILAYWNFRLSRHDGGTLQVTRGLITTRATSIERRRLVGAEISEALLLRSVGGARALAVATGLRVGWGAERGGEVLLPPAPHAEAEGVAATVLDGTPAVTALLRRHGANARRRRLIRAVVSSVVIWGLAWIAYAVGGSFWLVIVGAVPLAGSVPLGLDRYRSLGHALVDGYLVTRFGSLVRRRTVLASEAVIGWNLRSTYFQRRLGLITLTATTAAGRQGYEIADLDPTEALALADAVVPDLLTQFRLDPHPAHPATSS